jgi:hypothetical protein
MASARPFIILVASVAMLFGANAARAETITNLWIGAEVSFILPDVVTYDETFDISFSIDTATAEPSITLAFMTFLDMSDTLTAAGSTWEYEFTSNEAPWNFSLTGTLGDATTPTTHDASGYSSRFFDPINGNYTWLWSDYEDKVVWTLHDLVLHEETSFALTLQAFLMAPVTFTIDVVETPLEVPEPSSAALIGLGLCFPAVCSRRSARRSRLSPSSRRRGST